jgi:hypothetical protein
MPTGEPELTVADLIEQLSDKDPAAVVRWAHNPRWSLEYEIAAVVQVDDAGPDDQPIVYLAEGPQVGYLSEDAAAVLGW